MPVYSKNQNMGMSSVFMRNGFISMEDVRFIIVDAVVYDMICYDS